MDKLRYKAIGGLLHVLFFSWMYACSDEAAERDSFTQLSDPIVSASIKGSEVGVADSKGKHQQISKASCQLPPGSSIFQQYLQQTVQAPVKHLQ